MLTDSVVSVRSDIDADADVAKLGWLDLGATAVASSHSSSRRVAPGASECRSIVSEVVGASDSAARTMEAFFIRPFTLTRSRSRFGIQKAASF